MIDLMHTEKFFKIVISNMRTWDFQQSDAFLKQWAKSARRIWHSNDDIGSIMWFRVLFAVCFDVNLMDPESGSVHRIVQMAMFMYRLGKRKCIVKDEQGLDKNCMIIRMLEYCLFPQREFQTDKEKNTFLGDLMVVITCHCDGALYKALVKLVESVWSMLMRKYYPGEENVDELVKECFEVESITNCLSDEFLKRNAMSFKMVVAKLLVRLSKIDLV